MKSECSILVFCFFSFIFPLISIYGQNEKSQIKIKSYEIYESNPYIYFVDTSLIKEVRIIDRDENKPWNWRLKTFIEFNNEGQKYREYQLDESSNQDCIRYYYYDNLGKLTKCTIKDTIVFKRSYAVGSSPLCPESIFDSVGYFIFDKNGLDEIRYESDHKYTYNKLNMITERIDYDENKHIRGKEVYIYDKYIYLLKKMKYEFIDNNYVLLDEMIFEYKNHYHDITFTEYKNKEKIFMCNCRLDKNGYKKVEIHHFFKSSESDNEWTSKIIYEYNKDGYLLNKRSFQGIHKLDSYKYQYNDKNQLIECFDLARNKMERYEYNLNNKIEEIHYFEGKEETSKIVFIYDVYGNILSQNEINYEHSYKKSLLVWKYRYTN